MRINYDQTQQDEIATIKERTITLKLSDADCFRIAKKAGCVGLSVGELMENFIGDLIAGTYSNGSDERMYAEQWFDRCGFSWMNDKTLLKYLLDWDHDVEDFLTLYDEIQYYKEHPEEYAEELEIAKAEGDELIWCETEFNEIVESYKRDLKDDADSDDLDLQKEISICQKWYDELKKMQGIE